MATGRQDFSTYQHDLTPPCGLAQHVPGPLVATPGSYQYRASDAGAGVLGQRGHSIPDKTRQDATTCAHTHLAASTQVLESIVTPAFCKNKNHFLNNLT
jgi:hypothetical protein